VVICQEKYALGDRTVKVASCWSLVVSKKEVTKQGRESPPKGEVSPRADKKQKEKPLEQ
jgi:hypothetical protein